MEHPAVAEAGVIGKPDPVAGEIVKAFVALKPGSRAGARTRSANCWPSCARRLGTAVAPKEIDFLPTLPKTRSGKIMRRLLKARELGLPGRRHVDAGVGRVTPCARRGRSRCCEQMLRIRRFEEKCAELYSAGKIRGFLHLYIGEEAIAAGVMPALDRRRRGGRHLSRTRSRAGARPDRGKRDGRDVRQARGLQPRPRRFDAPVRCLAPLLRRQCHRRRRPAARGRAGAGRQDAEARPRDRVLLRRRRGGGGRVSREHEPGGAVEAAGAVPVREQPLRDGHRPVALGVRYRPGDQGGELQHGGGQRRRHGRGGGVATPRTRRSTPCGGWACRTSWSCKPIASAPTPCSIPSCTATRPKSSSGRSTVRSRPSPRACARPAGSTSRGHRGDARRTSTQEIGRAVAFAEAGTLEPVEDLERDVYARTRRRARRSQREAHDLSRGVARRPARGAAARPARVSDGRGRRALWRQLRVSARACSRSSARSACATRRCRSRPSSAPASARRLGGMRPIVEIMTVNFSLLALDQIVNNAATLRHMSGGQFDVPLVIRMATGGGRQLAAQHSHSLEGWYAHIPGLRIVTPATLEDARGMLWTALQDPDPVIIFEHVMLYNLEGELAEDAGAVDIDRAAVRRRGHGREPDHLRRHASARRCRPPRQLAQDGISAEVIDLRTLRPLDDANHPRVGGADASRGDRRRRLEKRQPLGGDHGAHHGTGLLRTRCAGGARVQPRRCRFRMREHLEEAALPQVSGIVAAAKGGHAPWMSSACRRWAPTWKPARWSSGTGETRAARQARRQSSPWWKPRRARSTSRSGTTASSTGCWSSRARKSRSASRSRCCAAKGRASSAGATLGCRRSAAVAPAVEPASPPDNGRRPAVSPARHPAPRVKCRPPRGAARRNSAWIYRRSRSRRPDGVVALADVERAAQKARPPTPGKRAEADRLEAMRAAIGAAMAKSKREIPHYYLGATIDVDPRAVLAGTAKRRVARSPSGCCSPRF